MKKIISLLTLLFPLISIAQQNNVYVLEGKMSKPATITLQYMIDGKTFKNTAEVTNGEIKLTGTINTKIQASLLIAPDEQLSSGSMKLLGTIVHLWLEPGHIKVYNLDSIQKTPTFSGTPLNNEANALNQEESVLNDISDNKQRDSLREIIVTSFIKAHPRSLVSLTELNYTLSRGVPDLTVVEPLFNGLSTEVKASSMGKDYQQKLSKWKIVDVGSLSPDFTQPDQNGNPVKLSDFKGKYILVDFWASWCHPCRDEHPDLIKQYNLYKDKSFVILAVSIDGGGFGTQASWLRAIADDHIGDWINVCDLKGYKKNTAKLLYNVGSIPQNFLINPDGKIIGKGLRGEDLDNKLKEIFNNTNNGSLTGSNSPGIDDSKILSLDSVVRTGRLANGFTYYIRRNTMPKNRVIFYLANKVGSILENDNQRGLAHFIEHMNFDGTTHFPKYELVNYLQKSGIRFGADLNAYTSFDETVYQLPLPSDNPDILNNGIQIMRDWARGALLDSSEMNKERLVVLEEKRMGKGADERMRREYLPVLLNNSRYADRLPIGIDTVLDNFKPQTLRDFYNDWYRPDLQALIVVGDINVDQIEKAIRDKFSDLKNPVNERARQIYTVPLTGKNQFIRVTDKEQTKTSIEVIIKQAESKFKTAGDYRNYMIQQLFNEMIQKRIAELSANKSDPPFVTAGAGIGNILGGIDSYSTTFVANPGELERGFKAVWRETERVKLFGFTASELARAKAAFLSHTESAVGEISTTNSNTFVNEYLQNFLKDIPSPGITEELQLTKAYLPGINLESIQNLIKEYIRTSDRDIIVFGPEKDKSNLPAEQKINQWITEVDAENIIPYHDTFIAKTLLHKEPVPGKIIKERNLKSIDATEWTLSNGVKVILKKTDFSANYILLGAFAPGGSSVYSDNDYPTASNAAYILDRSGLGNFTSSDLNKFLSGRDLFSGTSIDDYHVQLQGGATIKDLEALLQVTYAKFTLPRFDQEAFKGTIASFRSSIENHGNDAATVFQDTIHALLTNYNVREANLDTTRLAQINLDKAFAIYNRLFGGDVSNFVFCFSGPIDVEKMRPLVEKYIASLPVADAQIKPKDLDIYPPAGKITKTIYKGLEPKAIVNLTFSGTYSYSAKNNKTLEALKEIIQINLINRLRKDEGGVYSPSTGVSYQKTPEQRYRLRINFECAPQNVEKLIAAALDEVSKIKTNGPAEEDIEKFKAEDQRVHEINLKSDFSWLQYIQNQLLDKESLNEVNEYDNIIKKITKENIRDAANKYLSGDNLIQLILNPEKQIY